MLCFVDVEFLTDCQIVVINGCRNKFPSFISICSNSHVFKYIFGGIYVR